jgi:hypothetical protein
MDDGLEKRRNVKAAAGAPWLRTDVLMYRKPKCARLICGTL